MLEARKKAYNIFPPEVKDESLSKQINIVKYIDHLGHATKTTIDGWPILDIFKNADTGLFYTDRSKINEIFFQFRETVPAEASKVEAISEQVSKTLTAVHYEMARWALHHAKASMDQMKEAVRSASKTLEGNQRELLKRSSAWKGLKQIRDEGKTNFAAEIASVLLDGFYELHEVQNKGGLRFKTRPIQLSFFNKAQAVTNVVPMGTYVLNIRIGEDGLISTYVQAGENNPTPGSDYIHPHVLRGVICYGSMLSDYNVARATFDVKKVALLAKEALNNYNDGNPHVHLYKFEEAWKKQLFAKPSTFASEPFWDDKVEEETEDEDNYYEEDDNSEEESSHDDFGVASNTNAAGYSMSIPASSANLTEEMLVAARASMDYGSSTVRVSNDLSPRAEFSTPYMWEGTPQTPLDRHRLHLQSAPSGADRYTVAEQNMHYEYRRDVSAGADWFLVNTRRTSV